MPTVLRSGRYRFFFYSNEGSEPPHVHVEAGGQETKFWLSPVALATNHGFAAHELHELEAIIRANLTTLQGAWNAYFKP
jgi:Domain of unknown function (DUF4160)